jgi:hypothetical protein
MDDEKKNSHVYRVVDSTVCKLMRTAADALRRGLYRMIVSSQDSSK